MIANIAATDGMHRRHPFLYQGIPPPKKTRLMTYEIEKNRQNSSLQDAWHAFFFFTFADRLWLDRRRRAEGVVRRYHQPTSRRRPQKAINLFRASARFYTAAPSRTPVVSARVRHRIPVLRGIFWAAAKNRYTLSVCGQKKVHTKIK